MVFIGWWCLASPFYLLNKIVPTHVAAVLYFLLVFISSLKKHVFMLTKSFI